MNPVIFKNIGLSIVNHFQKNGITYAKKIAEIIIISSITAATLHKVHKNLEKKHRKEDAEKYKEETTKQINELKKEFWHNQEFFKKKVNDMCDDYGIPHVF